MALSEPFSLKVAVTVTAFAALMVHAAVPEQGPDHPAKVELAAGTAFRVTEVPPLKVEEQVCPQSMPAGLLVITPVPGPATDTASDRGPEKVAPTLVSAFRTTVHFAVPEQAPDQPEKVLEAAGLAVRVMDVPGAKVALQVAPQLIPAGALVTLPEPVVVTVRVNCEGCEGGGVCSTLPPQPLRAIARYVANPRSPKFDVARTEFTDILPEQNFPFRCAGEIAGCLLLLRVLL
jgi:hypothetical protein